MDINTSLFFEANSSHDIEYAQRYFESLSPDELDNVLKKSGVEGRNFKDVISLIASLSPEEAGQTTFNCPRCGEDQARMIQTQTRSTDEGVTTFFACGACSNSWSTN